MLTALWISKKGINMKYFLNLFHYRYLLSNEYIILQVSSRTHFGKQYNKAALYKKRGMMIPAFSVRLQLGCVMKVGCRDFRKESRGETNQDDVKFLQAGKQATSEVAKGTEAIWPGGEETQEREDKWS